MAPGSYSGGLARSALMLVLACFVLVTRGLVPPGYMVDRDVSSGGWSIVVCEGQAVRGTAPEASHHHHDGGPEDEGDRNPDHPCVFMGLAAVAAHDVPTLASAPEWLPAGTVAIPVGRVVPGRGIAAPPPPPTGPPILI